MGRHKKSTAECNRYYAMRLQTALHKISDKRTFLRLHAVLLVAQGMSIEAVATMADKTKRVIYYWIDAYLKDHLVQSLFDAPKSGRPISAQRITDKRILRALKGNPLLLGYNTTVWTVALLARHLSSLYECEIRPYTLYRRMKALGLRCKRPRYVYSEKDPNRTQKKGRLSES